MALNKKKQNTNKKTPSANNRRNIPPQQRRPVSPSAAGRQATPQNRQNPVKAKPKNLSKNAPKKRTLQGQKNARPSAPPTSRNSMARNTVQNVRKMAPLKDLAPKKHTPEKAVKPAPKKVGDPVKKTAPKPAGKTAPRKQGSVQSSQKYHGGNYILYYMLGGLVIMIVLVILANTVLFRLNTINVSGNTRYTSEEITERSMIEMGKNLLHINVRQAEENIVSSLAYIDAAKVKRSFPTGISITVTEAEKWFYVRHGNTTAAVSHAGKVIEHSYPNGMTVFTGYESESVDIGAWLKSTTDGKTNMPEIILNAIEKAELENVDEVDLNDRFSIKIHIDGGRVILELGTIAQMEGKLLVANKLIREEISPSERGTVLVSNPEQATFIPENNFDMDDMFGDPEASDNLPE